jgi:hypothetical protein
MNANTDLKQIERKAWTIYFQDGFWDIYMGLLMLGIGLNILIDTEWYTLLMIAPILLMIIGKRFITTPRLGRVKFGSERQKKRFVVAIVLAVSVLLGIIFVALQANGIHLPKASAAAVFGINAVLVFGLMAYFLDCKRMYLYGLLLAIAFSLDTLINDPLASTAFLVFGSAALIFGLALFIIFLRKYPKITNVQDTERKLDSNA